MDKRSWPWRKKPSERPSSASETSESSSFPSTRHLDFQDVTTILSDYSRVADDGATQLQSNEETIKVLQDRLSAAMLDAANKEMLAKQHAKLAEEAVSGWETVEVEAASLKQQLESTIQQKLATEDRVSHLDGALKECMRQLRSVREEQEENIHNAIMKKTREWDRKRYELEEKIADLEQKFFEKDAENRAISRSLQERTRSISEISDKYSKAQTNATMLQVRLDSSEKEKAVLKFELSVAHKELDIRNEEKGLSKKAADAASKQHMEDVKKVAKLDAECQRLRALIRKKLPGPGAIAQMKLEVEGPVSEKIDGRKKNGKGLIASKDSSLQAITQEDHLQDKEGDLLSDRYNSLEEETKLLREMLAKRNNELQSVRLMCARTASKLSSVEQELEARKSNYGPQKLPVLSGLEMLAHSVEPSFASVSEDGNDGEISCAESWASALIAELDQFKKGKFMPIASQKKSASNTGALDDFSELEQLASLHPCDKHNLKQSMFDDHEDGAATEQLMNMADSIAENNTLSEASLTKGSELYETSELCEEGTTKLPAAGLTDQASLINLKQKLISLFEESADVADLLEHIRADIGLQGPLPANMRRSLICHGCSHDESSDPKPARQHILFLQDVLCCSSEADRRLYEAVSELTLGVCKVAQLLEDFVATSNMENQCQAPENKFSTLDLDPSEVLAQSLGQNVQLPENGQFRTNALDAKWQKLVAASNNFLNGKVELKQLMVAVSSFLSHFSRIKLSESNDSDRGFIQSSGEMEFTGVVGSPLSDSSKSECSEADAKIVPADENTHTCGEDIFSPRVLRLEEEPSKAVSENSALETRIKTEEGRVIEMEQELLQLKVVEKELEATLEKNQVELEQLRLQRRETDQMLSSFRAQLAAAESSKHLTGQQLIDMAVSKEELDSQLHTYKTELSSLQDHVKAITSELLEERKKNSDLQAKCEELQDQLDIRSGWSCPQCAMAAGAKEQVSRELKIAEATEKLAECERTIYILGHQLKALASPNGSPHQAVQRSPSFDQAQPDIITCLRSNASTGYDNTWQGGNSARFLKPRDSSQHNSWEGANSARYSEPTDFFSNKTSATINEDTPWDPRQSIASDILESELISLSTQGQTSGGKIYNMFGNKVPVHEDYIEAVAQMPSSPEADAASPKRFMSKPPRRKKKSPRSFAGIDMSKSMNDACSPSSAEKQGSSFSRFFSRTKGNH